MANLLAQGNLVRKVTEKEGVRDLARYIGNYIEKQVDGTIILQSPMLLEFSNVRHAFTTRQIIDAQAKEKFSELNMSLNSPDFLNTLNSCKSIWNQSS